MALSSYKIPLVFALLFVSLLTVHVSCFEYVVGGDRGKGWVKPDGSETETYNEWAEQHRFHIADTIRFKYKKDSVLQVEFEDYENCNRAKPVTKFEDGKNTVFEFDRSGFFYFISGKAGHCEAGQKMIIRVMAQSGGGEHEHEHEHHPPASAPSPSALGPAQGPGMGRDGGDGSVIDSWGPAVNSTVMLSVTSCLMTLFMGVVIVLYLF